MARHTVGMKKWEYRVFGSHLDPAELVVILDESGIEGWELVSVVPLVDYHPRELVDPTATLPGPEADEVEEEVIPVGAFRYIFKRPLE
jgi:hypothetical protein